MKLIIFDCDGTLIDSQNAIVAAMTMAFQAHDLEPAPRDNILGIVGLSLSEAIFALLPSYPPDLIADVVKSYRTAFFEIQHDPQLAEPMYDGAADLVRHFARRDGVLLAIATGKSRRGVTRFLERTGLEGAFVTIQTADTNPSKPHPSMIETAMGEVGVSSADSMMIGDTTFDIEMAAIANVTSVGVRWGYHPECDLREAGANYIARDMKALNGIIDGFVQLGGDR